jgi:hypothetical protein
MRWLNDLAAPIGVALLCPKLVLKFLKLPVDNQYLPC